MSNVKEIKDADYKIMLDRERTLRFDLNVFAELEDEYGTMEAAMEKLDSGSMKTIRKVLWLGLLNEDPVLTERQVGALITLPKLAELSATLNVAITGSLPAPESENKDQSTPAMGQALKVNVPN